MMCSTGARMLEELCCMMCRTGARMLEELWHDVQYRG